MISLDYTYSSLKLDDLLKHENRVKEIVKEFVNKESLGHEYGGWYEYVSNISDESLNEIINCAKNIKCNSQTLVVCGIGGSYLGARAVIEAIKGYFNSDIEVLYLGNTFDEDYTRDVLNHLKKVDFSINVISKSGSTLESAIGFRLLKELLEDKYGENYANRVYVTTDPEKGVLREMANKYGYKTFDIPSSIGGRYSVFTPVGLLPLAVAGVDIKEFVNGAKSFYKDFQNNKMSENIAYQYAAYRYEEYCAGKKVELFVTYKPYLSMISEWWKQLFGESEGKENKGLYPSSVTFSTDLHSLGQFVQQGTKLLFINQIRVLKDGTLKIKDDSINMDNLNYLTSKSLSEINNIAQVGTNKAHNQIGGVDNITIVMDEVNEFNIGFMLYFYMCSCMISAYLLDINPFDQPGVEFYKQEMKKILKNE